MHARLLDVLHDASDVNLAAVANRVDVDLDGVLQVVVEQHWIVLGDFHRLVDAGVVLEDQPGEVAVQIFRRVQDVHGAAAQHVGRANDQRKADLHRHPLGAFGVDGRAIRRLAQAEALQQRLEALPVFGEIDGVGRGAEDRNAGVRQRVRQLQRRLPAELHDQRPAAARPVARRG